MFDVKLNLSLPLRHHVYLLVVIPHKPGKAEFFLSQGVTL